MKSEVHKYLAEIGRRGGAKSRRVLTAKEATKMVQVREARRAYQRFHALCFWSFDVNLPIKFDDIIWVVEQLKKHGNRQAWEVAARLCR